MQLVARAEIVLIEQNAPNINLPGFFLIPYTAFPLSDHDCLHKFRIRQLCNVVLSGNLSHWSQVFKKDPDEIIADTWDSADKISRCIYQNIVCMVAFYLVRSLKRPDFHDTRSLQGQT